MKDHLEAAVQRMRHGSRTDRRKIDRPNLSPFELHVARLCRRTGVTFVGIQSRIGDVPAQAILINHYGSSFCCPCDDISIGRVLVELHRSEIPWKEAEDRRADQVRQVMEVQS